MVQAAQDPVPTEINLRTVSRVLELRFNDGSTFKLPCEYLRVFSPSAEVRLAKNRGELITGKKDVNISRIEPMGNYAVRLIFDDGHDTGVYSWKTLYDLGRDYHSNWQGYIERLESAGQQSNMAAEGASATRHVSLRVLYFASLVDQLGCEAETVNLLGSNLDVRALLKLLRERGGEWQRILADNAVKVTLNKEPASPETALSNNDEVAIVPLSTR